MVERWRDTDNEASRGRGGERKQAHIETRFVLCVKPPKSNKEKMHASLVLGDQGGFIESFYRRQGESLKGSTRS